MTFARLFPFTNWCHICKEIILSQKWHFYSFFFPLWWNHLNFFGTLFRQGTKKLLHIIVVTHQKKKEVMNYRLSCFIGQRSQFLFDVLRYSKDSLRICLLKIEILMKIWRNCKYYSATFSNKWYCRKRKKNCAIHGSLALDGSFIQKIS